jgi:hypothetical protein
MGEKIVLSAPVCPGRVLAVKTAEFLISDRVQRGKSEEAGDPTKWGRIASSDA